MIDGYISIRADTLRALINDFQRRLLQEYDKSVRTYVERRIEMLKHPIKMLGITVRKQFDIAPGDAAAVDAVDRELQDWRPRTPLGQRRHVLNEYVEKFERTHKALGGMADGFMVQISLNELYLFKHGLTDVTSQFTHHDPLEIH